MPTALPDAEALSRLLRISTLFLRDGNMEAVLGEILDAAIAITGADFGNIQLLDRDTGDLHLVVHRGFTDGWVDYWASVGRGRGSCGTALERGERVIIEDVRQSPIFARSPAGEVQRRAGVRAVQSTPIVGREGAPIGMISTHFRRPGRPDEAALQLVDLLARQAADILERARTDEKLREASRRKDEYLAMLGHELRNPLAAIRNATELIRLLASDDRRLQRAHGVLERQSRHMTRLVDGLLEVSRIASGKLDLDLEPVDLGRVIREGLEDRRHDATRRGLTLRSELPQAPVWVLGDRVRLAQVVDNLLGNALKFTPRGGHVTVSLHHDPDQARLRVRDTGAGIPPDMLGRIFEPFQQAAQDVARTAGGLGLGLAMVKGIVELHGGRVEAVSDGRSGAELIVHLPCCVTPAAEVPAPRPAVRARRRVLVVEDNPDAAQSLRDLLELMGHDVRLASSGLAALDALRADRPDIVLCDLGLPGMSGWDVARAVRADPQLRELPLVAISGYGQPEDRRRSAAAGFEAHLTKPVTADALAATIEAV